VIFGAKYTIPCRIDKRSFLGNSKPVLPNIDSRLLADNKKTCFPCPEISRLLRTPNFANFHKRNRDWSYHELDEPGSYTLKIHCSIMYRVTVSYLCGHFLSSTLLIVEVCAA